MVAELEGRRSKLRTAICRRIEITDFSSWPFRRGLPGDQELVLLMGPLSPALGEARHAITIW